MKKCVLLVASLLLLQGCIPIDPTGGECQYDDTAGTATIVSIETAPDGELNCPNQAMKVLFDFTPDNTEDADKAVSGRQLTISEGYNPPLEWLELEGIEVGTQLTCIRGDITVGTCSPITFTFPDLDMESATTICQESQE